MKVTYEFSSDEDDYVNIFSKSMDMYASLIEIDDYCRAIQKYQEKTPEDYIDRIREMVTNSGARQL